MAHFTTSFARGGLAVVIGANGAIGRALASLLRQDEAFSEVIALSRASTPALDLLSEPSIAAAATYASSRGLPLRLVFDATGFLHGGGVMPEKSWSQIDPDSMALAFRLNAIGPALLVKHFLPVLAAEGKSVLATLSARVGSIGDNRLGGWYSYRASKAALNQIVRTAAIELRRRRPAAICVALHPGTVESGLSEPFGKHGLDVRSPEIAAADLVSVIDRLHVGDSGRFFDHMGKEVPW